MRDLRKSPLSNCCMLAEPQEGEMGDVAFVLLKGVVRKEKLAHRRFRVRDVVSVLLKVVVRERNWPTCAAEFWTDVIGVSLARLHTDLWYTSWTYGIGLCSALLLFGLEWLGWLLTSRDNRSAGLIRA